MNILVYKNYKYLIKRGASIKIMNFLLINEEYRKTTESHHRIGILSIHFNNK